MTIAVAPTQTNLMKAVGDFLTAILPAGVEVFVGQANRVPEPKGSRFVIMTPTLFNRLATNLDTYGDVKFTGSMAGSVMTVTALDFGEIAVGATVFGVGVTDDTQVTALGTGTGSVGTYTVSKVQTLSGRTLSAGRESLQQNVEARVQLDFHAADATGGDLANTFTTLFRDDFGVRKFAEQNPSFGVVPLYADDAKQLPFQNAEQQWEWRWVVEAMLQVNPVVNVPQQFADSAVVDVVSVEAEFAP